MVPRGLNQGLAIIVRRRPNLAGHGHWSGRRTGMNRRGAGTDCTGRDWPLRRNSESRAAMRTLNPGRQGLTHLNRLSTLGTRTFQNLHGRPIFSGDRKDRRLSVNIPVFAERTRKMETSSARLSSVQMCRSPRIVAAYIVGGKKLDVGRFPLSPEENEVADPPLSSSDAPCKIRCR
jgi:hypothetical protein